MLGFQLPEYLKLRFSTVFVVNRSNAKEHVPVQLFANESKANLQSELNRIKTENDNLKDYRPPAINGVKVKYKSILSAIDGKVMNAFSDNNDCAACPFCKITWKDIMNDEKEIDLILNFLPHTLALTIEGTLVEFYRSSKV